VYIEISHTLLQAALLVTTGVVLVDVDDVVEVVDVVIVVEVEVAGL
jgi:hypothetical protein